MHQAIEQPHVRVGLEGCLIACKTVTLKISLEVIWITNEDPGFVNPDNPLEGFKTDANLFKYIPGFPQLPFDKIGSKLP